MATVFKYISVDSTGNCTQHSKKPTWGGKGYLMDMDGSSGPCFRLPHANAYDLYEVTAVGVRLIESYGEKPVSPADAISTGNLPLELNTDEIMEVVLCIVCEWRLKDLHNVKYDANYQQLVTRLLVAANATIDAKFLYNQVKLIRG